MKFHKFLKTQSMNWKHWVVTIDDSKYDVWQNYSTLRIREYDPIGNTESGRNKSWDVPTEHRTLIESEIYYGCKPNWKINP